MFSDVLAALEKSNELEKVLVVSGEPTLQDLALGERTTLMPDLIERASRRRRSRASRARPSSAAIALCWSRAIAR